MTKKELLERLTAEGVPPDMYHLEGGLPNEQLCLNQTYKGWEVYYSERGIQSDLKNFSSEEDACNYFYQQVKRLMKFM